MLRHTFQMTPGIGPSRERELWKTGITSWDAFPLPALSMRPDWLSGGHEERILSAIRRAESALSEGSLSELVRMFPAQTRWRLYRTLLSRAAFFDIETDGTNEATPTVVSIFSEVRGAELFIEGRNLSEVVPALASHPVWITFGGVRCDEPWLRARFPALPRPAFHFDLCPFARSLGLKGGLKPLEERLGFGRPPHLKGVTGRDAIFLWASWTRGKSRAALQRLCEYNLYDAIQLRTLADILFNRAVQALGLQADCQLFGQKSPPSVPVFRREAVLPQVQRLVQSI